MRCTYFHTVARLITRSFLHKRKPPDSTPRPAKLSPLYQNLMLYLRFTLILSADTPRPAKLSFHSGTAKSLTENLRLYCAFQRVNVSRDIREGVGFVYMGADKSLARQGMIQANVSVRMAWISFRALPKEIFKHHLAVVFENVGPPFQNLIRPFIYHV